MPRNFGLRRHIPGAARSAVIWTAGVFEALLILLLIVGGLGYARGHSWYPPECCSDRDCAPLPASQQPTPLPGGAWMLVSGEVVPREKVKWSPDAAFHLCKLPWEPFTTYCLFVPPVGS